MARRGRQAPEIPSRIANAPVLMRGLDLFWRAFWALTTDRPAEVVSQLGDKQVTTYSFIPWASVHAWAVAHHLDDDATEALHSHIRSMDVAYIEEKAHKGARPVQPGEREPHGHAPGVRPTHPANRG